MEENDKIYSVYCDGECICDDATFEEAMDMVSFNESYDCKMVIERLGEPIYATEDDGVFYRVIWDGVDGGEKPVDDCDNRYEAKALYDETRGESRDGFRLRVYEMRENDDESISFVDDVTDMIESL